MKNVFLLPTDKPSRIYLIKSNNRLGLTSTNPEYMENFGSETQNQHIFITSDEEIKEGDWCLDVFTKTVYKFGKGLAKGQTTLLNATKKIILATDGELIKAGVQAISDEFLEWFVENPGCEAVDIKKIYLSNDGLWKEVLLPSEWEVNTKVKRLIIPKEQYKKK